MRALFILPLLFLCVSYFPVLSAKQTVDPDAQVILNNLREISGPIEYVTKLFSLETVDFQPVRDLSLSLDLWIYNFSGLNTFVLQNVIWWFLSLILVSRIIFTSLPAINRVTLSLVISGLAVYPLFSGVISWGMNRKHLLSFFFILLATDIILKRYPDLRRRDIVGIVLFYMLAVLSQPINILWPVWAISFLIAQGFWNRKSKIFSAIIASVAFILITANTFYYTKSPVYNFFYPGKTSDLFNIPDKLLAVGHYIFQLFFPYLLAFKYDLSHWSTLAGLLLLVVWLFALMKFKDARKDLALWTLFAALPLLVVLSDPQVLADAYLLIPAVGLLLCLLILLSHKPSNIKPGLILVPVIIWTAFTFNESSAWTDRFKLAQRGFHRRPSCLSAINYVKVGYDLYKINPDGLEYMGRNECLKRMEVSPFFYRSMIILFAHHYFHAEDIPLEQRLRRLKELSDKHHFAHLSLIGLLVKTEKFEDAKSEASLLGERWRDVKISADYHEITVRYVHNFCKKNGLLECQAITEKLTKKTGPNL